MEDIFKKEIYCIIKIEPNKFEIAETNLNFDEALEQKARLKDITGKDVYFVDLTHSAKNALNRYKEQIKKYNRVFEWGRN